MCLSNRLYRLPRQNSHRIDRLITLFFLDDSQLFLYSRDRKSPAFSELRFCSVWEFSKSCPGKRGILAVSAWELLFLYIHVSFSFICICKCSDKSYPTVFHKIHTSTKCIVQGFFIKTVMPFIFLFYGFPFS